MRAYMHEYINAVRLFSRNIKLYLIAAFLIGISNTMVQVIYNLYLKQLGYGADLAGLLITLTSASAMLLSLPAGWLSKQVGPRRVMLISAVAALPFSIWRFTTAGRLGLDVSNFLYGATAALTMVAVSPFLSENSSPAEQTHLFSLSRALEMATGIFGSLIGGALPGLAAHVLKWNPEGVPAYRLTLVISVALLALSFVPLLLLRETHAAVQARRLSRKQPLSRRSFEVIAWFGATQLLIGLGAGMFVPFMNRYMSDVLQLPTRTIGFWFGVSALTQAAATIIAPAFASRNGKVRLIVGTQTLSIPFVLMLAFARSSWVAILAFLLRTMLMNMNSGVFTALSMEAIDENARGTMSGIQSLVFELGWVIGPLVGGFLITAYGYRPIFLCGAILYTVSTALFYGRFKSLENIPSQPAQV